MPGNFEAIRQKLLLLLLYLFDFSTLCFRDKRTLNTQRKIISSKWNKKKFDHSSSKWEKFMARFRRKYCGRRFFDVYTNNGEWILFFIITCLRSLNGIEWLQLTETQRCCHEQLPCRINRSRSNAFRIIIVTFNSSFDSSVLSINYDKVGELACACKKSLNLADEMHWHRSLRKMNVWLEAKFNNLMGLRENEREREREGRGTRRERNAEREQGLGHEKTKLPRNENTDRHRVE